MTRRRRRQLEATAVASPLDRGQQLGRWVAIAVGGTTLFAALFAAVQKLPPTIEPTNESERPSQSFPFTIKAGVLPISQIRYECKLDRLMDGASEWQTNLNVTLGNQDCSQLAAGNSCHVLCPVVLKGEIPRFAQSTVDMKYRLLGMSMALTKSFSGTPDGTGRLKWREGKMHQSTKE